MFCFTLLVLLMRISFVVLQGELVVFDVQSDTVDLKKIYKYRCTRRYSPGTCIKEVQPVWTFEFQIQNCTERVGCLHAVRSNRFDSYVSCMKKCRRLIELYAKILSFEQQSHTDVLRKGSDISSRRELPLSDEPSDYGDQEDGQEQDSEVFKYMYNDFETAGDNGRPINVDYSVPGADYIGGGD